MKTVYLHFFLSKNQNNQNKSDNNKIMNMRKCSGNEVDDMWDRIALILLIIGGVNWGLVGIFRFDLVAWLFGGSDSILSRAIYIIVAISAIWCISLLFRPGNKLLEATDS